MYSSHSPRLNRANLLLRDQLRAAMDVADAMAGRGYTLLSAHAAPDRGAPVVTLEPCPALDAEAEMGGGWWHLDATGGWWGRQLMTSGKVAVSVEWQRYAATQYQRAVTARS